MTIKPIDSMIDFSVFSLAQILEEIVCEHLPPEVMNKYHRVARIQKLHIQALMHGWTEFDWKRVAQEGWLSKHDCEVFKEELNGMTYEEMERLYNEHKKGNIHS